MSPFAPLLLSLAITAFSALPALAQMQFQGGQVGVSGFTLHESLYDEFADTYLVDDRFDEIEGSVDLVFSTHNFGVQVGGHIGSVRWRSPAATANLHYGFNLHGHYISPNGNKFGLVAQYLDLGPPAPNGYRTSLIGLESLFAFGSLDIETSASVYSTAHNASNILATLKIYYPVTETLEIQAGYTYWEFGALYPMNQYSLGVAYIPQGSAFRFNFEYTAGQIQTFESDIFQFGIKYRFGEGNTGRLFTDRTSGYGRFST